MSRTVSEIVGPRHVERFQCIGPRCEEHCCGSSWNVLVDDAHLERLRRAMDDSPKERTRFAASVETLRDRAPGAGAVTHALVMRESGDCALLDDDGWCHVHRQFGEATLPETCATFPRLAARAGARDEVWATLSCPEIGRLALLVDDGMTLCALDPAKLPPGARYAELPPEPSRPYDRYLDDLRATALRILALPAPLPHRLLTLSRLGERTRDFFRRDAPSVDEARLGEEIHLALHPEALAAYGEELDAIAPAREVTLTFLATLLEDRLAQTRQGTFQALATAALAAGFPDGGATLDAAKLRDAYEARRAAWEGAHEERVDRIFTNYARGFWMREWYVSSPDLHLHAQKLAVRVALARLFLFNHPKLDGADPAGEGAGESVDAAAVDAVYKLSRGLDHSAGFVRRLGRALDEQRMGNLEKLLLKF